MGWVPRLRRDNRTGWCPLAQGILRCSISLPGPEVRGLLSASPNGCCRALSDAVDGVEAGIAPPGQPRKGHGFWADHRLHWRCVRRHRHQPALYPARGPCVVRGAAVRATSPYWAWCRWPSRPLLLVVTLKYAIFLMRADNRARAAPGCWRTVRGNAIWVKRRTKTA